MPGPAARNQPLRSQTHDRLAGPCIKASRAHDSHLLQFPLISRLRTEGRPLLVRRLPPARSPLPRRWPAYPKPASPITSSKHRATRHNNTSSASGRIGRKKMEASVGIRARPGAWAGLEKPRGAYSARAPPVRLTPEKLPERLALGTGPRRSTDPVLRAAKLKASCCKKSAGTVQSSIVSFGVHAVVVNKYWDYQGRKWISYDKIR